MRKGPAGTRTMSVTLETVVAAGVPTDEARDKPAGMNLPMLIKFASDRKRLAVAELAAQLKLCGRESISVPADYLR